MARLTFPRVTRGMLSIGIGTALGQGVAFAALPVLSRLYTPAQIADFALLLAVGNVVASFAGLRLERALPIPEDESQSRQIYWVAVAAPAVVLPAIALPAILLFSWTQGAELVDPLDVGLVCVYVVAAVFLAATSQLAIRLRAYDRLARLPVIQAVGTFGAQVSLGVMGAERGLLAGGVLGRALGTVGLARACRVTRQDAPSREEARTILTRYWRFPALFAPAALVNTLGLHLPLILIPAVFGLPAAGLYAMATRVASTLGSVVVSATSQVFLGELARLAPGHASVRAYMRWSLLLALLALATTGLVVASAPLLPAILGEQWEGTQQLAVYAGVVAGAAIVGSPVQGVWTLRERAPAQFAWNVARLALTGAVIGVGAERGWSITTVAEGIMVSACITYGIAWLGCLWAASHPSVGRVRTGPALEQGEI